jgi:hypothetical protein
MMVGSDKTISVTIEHNINEKFAVKAADLVLIIVDKKHAIEV